MNPSDAAVLAMIAALDAIQDGPKPRHYAPDPCAPTDDEIEAQAMGEQSFDEWCENQMAYHGGDRR